VLFQEATPPTASTFVTDGTLRITKRSGDGGHPIVRNSVGPGDVLGEIASARHPADGDRDGVGPARLLSVDARSFTRIVLDADLTAPELAQLRAPAPRRRRPCGAAFASERGVSRGTLDAIDAAPGETILRKGDPAAHFYLLVDGSVDVVVERASGQTSRSRDIRAPD
jgi:CRP-like cAMP-binding protein